MITVVPLLFAFCAASGAQVPDQEVAYAALAESESADGQAWYDLAGTARAAGAADVAERALRQAEGLQYSPLRIGLERARIAIVQQNPRAATGELQKIADSGFTGVQVITNDPLISRLAGYGPYDVLIESMSVQAFPCEHENRFREFDFWVGVWEVRTANGQLAGHNTIRSAERGCVLTEHWTSATGGTGMSVNYLDQSKDKWVQVWMAADGSQITISGGLTDAGMSLRGTLHNVGSGGTLPFRGLWTPLPDGRVRQFFEQSSDGGSSWVPWFEGFYTRIAED
jgi:hypothetical protein